LPVAGCRAALQFADAHGLALGDLAHAGLLAERLGRADAGAHAAEDVLAEDGDGGALRLPAHDLADEHRDVDAGRAGLLAGRVVAEVAAVGLDHGLVLVERRMEVAEVGDVVLAAEPPRGNVRHPSGRHDRSLPQQAMGLSLE
jgi:hypothetical protein